MSPVSSDPVELMLNRTWRPQLATIGMAGLPLPGDAGNVLRPETRARLSLRLHALQLPVLLLLLLPLALSRRSSCR